MGQEVDDGNGQQDENSNSTVEEKNTSNVTKNSKDALNATNESSIRSDIVDDASASLPEAEKKASSGELVASTPSSVTSTAESDPPIVSEVPRQSIVAALRRGSFYGDAKPHHASIAEVVAAAEPNQQSTPSFTTEQTSSHPEFDSTSTVSELEDEQLTNEARVHVMGFLRGMLERFELMAMLPGANSKKETSMDLASFPDGLPELATKTKILDAANLIKYSLGGPPKISKFAMEVAYLIKVISMTLKEVEERGTFYKLINLIEEDSKWVRMLPDGLQHVRALKEKMEMLKNVMEVEAQAHHEARRQWARNIVQQKLELKELRKQNMIQYRYKADNAIAAGDLSRREYGVRLIDLRAENVRLKNDIEVEKVVYEASVEFLKKQNMALREEAVALQAGIELDTHNLDHILEKMRLQRKEKEAILAELEPRYLARMAEIEAARVEAIWKQEEFFANQGQIELQTFAALKIQRIWRGHLVRKVWSHQLRKLKRKRLAAKKKKGGNAGKKKKTKKKK